MSDGIGVTATGRLAVLSTLTALCLLQAFGSTRKDCDADT